MNHPIIALIGGGNMGASLITGLIKNGHPANKIWAADPSQERLNYLQSTFNINVTTDNTQAANAANVILFAVKPHYLAKVATHLQTAIHTHQPLIISIVAGIRIHSIEQWIGKEVAIVRTMPNTPALIRCGATALYANAHVTAEQHDLAESILRAVGITVWLENESLLDIVTALSGSGPAYFFHMMEALQTAAEELGLPNDIARILTLQTALGSARMALETETPLAELQRNVTSPGGTTERAISVLEEHNLRLLYKKAVQAAKLRSEELANQLGEVK